jgi:vacuolar protein sorting-associated protein 11
MLTSLPDETTQLLVDLCTSSGPLTFDTEDSPSLPIKQATGPSYLSYLALNRASAAPPTISSDTATPPSPSIKTFRQGDSLSRRGSMHEDSSPPTPPPVTTSHLAVKRQTVAPVKKLSPRIYFAHFVDHMDHFVIFLETVALRRWGQTVEVPAPSVTVSGEPPADEAADKQDQVAVWNTLLELYLTLPLSGSRSTKDEKSFRGKALRVLNSETIPYDPTHALILCSSHSFTPGLVLLWEKMGMYEDVLRFWMDQDKEGLNPSASAEVIRHLNLYGPTRPHLYPLVLRFLTSTPELLSKHRDDVAQVLEHIEQERILPPLAVIQVLSRNGVASVGLVKEWLMQRIKHSKEDIHTVRFLLNSGTPANTYYSRFN